MMLARRRLLQLAAAASLPAFARRASAQAYPARPVRMLVGFAPGGASDVAARVTAQWLSERLGQQFVVENRTGAGGNIASEAVLRSAPDGYTLLVVAPANAINASLYEKLNFDFMRDAAPVCGILRVPNVMEVNPAVPATTTAEFISYAKARPGELSYASAGVGTASHMAGELFKVLTGVNLVHVPFRGNGPAMTALLGGQVRVGFGDMASAIEYIKAGNLRGLAVTTAARSPALPELPTVADVVPGYEASSWFGVAAPRGTPPDIIATLNREINLGLADPASKAKLANVGGTTLPGSAADFGKLIADETEKWAKVVKAAGAKAE